MSPRGAYGPMDLFGAAQTREETTVAEALREVEPMAHLGTISRAEQFPDRREVPALWSGQRVQGSEHLEVELVVVRVFVHGRRRIRLEPPSGGGDTNERENALGVREQEG